MTHIERAINKAVKSPCRYKIAAVGFNKRGDMIGIFTNKPRFKRYHGGTHAEMALVQRYPSIKTVMLCRVGKKGNILPIHPCANCAKILAKLKIKVITVVKNET